MSTWCSKFTLPLHSKSLRREPTREFPLFWAALPETKHEAHHRDIRGRSSFPLRQAVSGRGEERRETILDCIRCTAHSAELAIRGGERSAGPQGAASTAGEPAAEVVAEVDGFVLAVR